MAARGIPFEWVDMAIRFPDWTAQDPDPVLIRSFKSITGSAGRILRVVHRSDGADILVVTAHFDRGAKR